MNENINLEELLEDCPKGTEFFSNIFGPLFFECISHLDGSYPVRFKDKVGDTYTFTPDAKYVIGYDMCVFPSKDQRDWSKWQCPKPKKPKFDPKTLNPFDKVLVRIGDGDVYCWSADFVSMPCKDSIPCTMSDKDASMVIPYNEETKHLVGTTDEAPEYYRYWED